MTQFGACFKKDMIESFRTKRFWFMFGVAIGMVVLSSVVGIVLDSVCNILDESSRATVKAFNGDTPSILWFTTFMQTYFVFISIFMFCNIIPKEIRNKKWINPVSAGINPKYMFLSKLLMTLITTVATAFVACIIHFVFTIIYVSPELFSIQNLILQYCNMLVYLVFIMIVTVCLGSITKHGLISGAAVIGGILLFTTIFQYIPISAGGFLVSYTPFLFWEQCLIFIEPTTSQVLFATVITFVLCLILIVWATFATKIKGAKKLA